MKRLFALLLAFVSAGMLAAPLQAQDREPETETGSRLRAEPEPMQTRRNSNDAANTRRVAKRFANCIYDRRKEQSVQLLTVSDYWAIDYNNLGDAQFLLENRILMDDCLGRASRATGGVGMSFSFIALRGGLVEEAYLAVYSDENEPIVLDPEAPEVLTNRFFVPGPTYENARAAASFADCVIYQAPAQAHQILHTRPTSDEEREAVTAIVPAVGQCIKEGEEMRLNVASIRAFVADGLWARMHYGNENENSEGSE